MPKSPMPDIPGVAAVTDTLDFVKNLWGSMGVPGVTIPGMTAPTVSLDELAKKIADLKAVESWLNVNLSMLHGTIQALEVQRGTIATLKSMGASLAAAVQQPGASEKSVMAASPFASAFFAQPAAAKQPEAAQQAGQAAPEAASAGAPMTNPAAWWNLLQDQFQQAVSSAMSPEAMAGATAMAQDAAARMAAASRPAAEMGKAMSEALAKGAAAADTGNDPAKPAAAKPKPAKPRNGES
jgi:hypothetical protein